MAEVYRHAAAVLQLMDSQRIGLRDALYGAARPPQKALSRVYALLSKTLAVRQLLQQLLCQVGLVDSSIAAAPESAKGKAAAIQTTGSREYLLLLMLRDLLLSPKGIQGGGQLKRLLLEHESHLRSLYSATAADSTEHEALAATAATAIPRYLRVNLRVWDAEAAANFLKARLPRSLWAVTDPLLPCVIALPAAAARLLKTNEQQRQQQRMLPRESPETKDTEEGAAELQVPFEEQQLPEQPQQQEPLLLHQLVPRGFASLQDRASCTAAAAAAIAEGDIILEGCAAPGSKTLHILEMLDTKGHLIVLERDKKRLAAMLRRLQQEAALRGPYLSPCCKPQHAASSNRSKPPGKASSDSNREESLWLAELAGKRPLYFARSSELPGSAAVDAPAAPAAASYPKIAAALPMLLVEVRRADFAAVDGKVPPFCCAQKIVLDPSCSGSGLPIHAVTTTAIPAAARESCGKNSAQRLHAVVAGTKARTCDPFASASTFVAAVSASSVENDPPDLLRWSWEGWKYRASVCSSSEGPPLDGRPADSFDGPLPGVVPLECEEERVVRLAAMQRKLLLHALTAFPAACLVCYSTCSLYVHENEAVLLGVGLQQPQQHTQRLEGQTSQQQERQSTALQGWQVFRPSLHPGWFVPAAAVSELRQQIRNSSSRSTEELEKALESFGSLCVRASFQTHKCRGFFLATVRRISPSLGTATAAAITAAEKRAAGTGGGKTRKRKREPNELVATVTSLEATKTKNKRKIRGCTKAGIRI